MNKKIIEILNFLFKKYIAQTKDSDAKPFVADKDMMLQLMQNGFTEQDICDAFTWFINLLVQQYFGARDGSAEQLSSATRIFVKEEIDKLGEAGCSFLLFLQKAEVLTAQTREIVINQLMQLPSSKSVLMQCSLDEIKWVVFMVLLSQNNNKNGNQLLQKFVLCVDKRQGYEC